MGEPRARLSLQPPEQRQPGLPGRPARAAARQGGARPHPRRLRAGASPPGDHRWRTTTQDARLLRHLLHGEAPGAAVTTEAPPRPAPPQRQAPTGSDRVDAAKLAALADRVTHRGEGDEWIEIENPANGTPLAKVRRCETDDIELAVRRAREAQAR